MVSELTDIVVQNWDKIALAGVIASALYGTYKSSSGIYEIIKTGTNKGIVKVVIGGSILAASGMAAAVFGKLSTYLSPYQ